MASFPYQKLSIVFVVAILITEVLFLIHTAVLQAVPS